MEMKKETWFTKFIEKRKEGHRKTMKAWKSLNYINIFWLFVIASVAGFLVESLYAFLKLGFFESRQGLVFGPFSQIYGIGAVLLAVVLLPLKERGKGWVFVGSGIVGGLFETFASLVQEGIFNTVSWQYVRKITVPLFGGRTSLLYMLYWSILGYFYIKNIYPSVMGAINKVPRKFLNILTIFVSIFVLFDIVISGMAVFRWSERVREVPAKNIVSEWLDENFDNDRMKKVYPNMKFPD